MSPLGGWNVMAGWIDGWMDGRMKDVATDKIVFKELRQSGACSVAASEETPEEVVITEGTPALHASRSTQIGRSTRASRRRGSRYFFDSDVRMRLLLETRGRHCLGSEVFLASWVKSNASILRSVPLARECGNACCPLYNVG